MKRWLFLTVLILAAAFWWARTPSPLEPAAHESLEVDSQSPLPPLPAAAASPQVLAKPKASLPAKKNEGSKELSATDFASLFEKLDACELITQGVANRTPAGALSFSFFRRARFIPSDPDISISDINNFFRIFSSKNMEEAVKDVYGSLKFSPVLKFFVALLYADLVSVHLVANPDYRNALLALGEAEQGLSGNGALPFFRSSIRILSKQTDKVAASSLEQATRRGRFETFLPRIAKIIWESGLSDPKLFALSLSLVNRLPHLSFEPAYRTISGQLSERNPEWARLVLPFALQWMQEGLREGDRPANIYWPKEQYDLGRSLARKAWEALNPGKLISDTEGEWPASSLFAGADKLNPRDSGPFPPRREDGSCDLDAFRRYLNQLAQLAQEHQLGLSRRQLTD